MSRLGQVLDRIRGLVRWDRQDMERAKLAAEQKAVWERRYSDLAKMQAMIHGMLIPHHEQFAARWAAGSGDVYWTRFDEALHDSWPNALALRRSEFVHELLRHRQYPRISARWHIETDDPKDPDQQRVADQIEKQINAIPDFQDLRLYLSEDLWYGKYGSQIQWGTVQINGKKRTTIVDHEPVDGDSIVYHYDKTPGILVRAGWTFSNRHDQEYIEIAPRQSWMESTDRAWALFLRDQFWRDHFIISNFERTSADFLFEGEKAMAIFGLGLRSRLYFALQLRDELRSWGIEAMQRIGANGMLYGFFPSGNNDAMMAVLKSLAMLIRDNVTAFPVEKDAVPQEIRHIEPSKVGYEVMDQWIDRLEQGCRRLVLGQSLSSEAQSTGLGSEVAQLHRSVYEHYLRYDSYREADVLTRDVIKPMIRMNTWEYKGEIYKGYLPFLCRLVTVFDRADAVERTQVINAAYSWGLELDKEEVYKDTGLSPPKDPKNVLKKPEPQPGMPGAPGMGGPGGAGPEGPAGMPAMPPLPGADGNSAAPPKMNGTGLGKRPMVAGGRLPRMGLKGIGHPRATMHGAMAAKKPSLPGVGG
jgi:hypothetical protein